MPGRIVSFVIDEQSANDIHRQRMSVRAIQDRMDAEHWPLAWYQAHIWNEVKAGEIYPAMVTRVWDQSGSPSNCVNLKVILDGTDTFWATSVHFDSAKAPRTWH